MTEPCYALATYRVSEKRQGEFLQLLDEGERVMREEGLITERPAIRMRSEAPELLLQVFEWVDWEAFDRALTNARVQAVWRKYEDVWEEGPVRLDAFPEAARGWPRFAAVSP